MWLVVTHSKCYNIPVFFAVLTLSMSCAMNDKKHCYFPILQVKATEVARSDAFKVQYYPRFPRITAVRYDKSPQDCLTVEEFHRIRSQGAGI